MGKKRRLSFRLEEDEAVVVATVGIWEHVMLTYNTCAEDFPPGEKQKWLDVATYISDWLESTRQKAEVDDEF